MNCRRVEEVIFLYVDNEMDGELRVSFREHVEICPGCARRMENALRLRALVRARCARALAPERLRRRIITSFPHRRI